MTTLAEPPPIDTVTRRFSPQKLAKWLARQESPTATWLAGALGRREQSVKNWLSGRNQPGIDAYLDLVDLMERLGHDESEILDKVR